MAEVLDDIAFGVAPLTFSEALDMIGNLKTQQLLNGFRGAKPLDREAFAEILIRLSELGEAVPGIQEIDINPLIVSQGKPIAVDASIIYST